MISLVFFASVAAIFGLIVALEAEGGVKLHRPVGLMTWITRGNWPAKIGGALIIVGCAALLRYALINIDVPAQLKLTGGIVIALSLGLASMFVPEGPARRPVSLALGGAAFGVVYLTAYSAFAFFQYLSNPAGLALLALTSAGAGIYAVTRGALSLALLSMVGAFLAPAFAVGTPGPAVVYGYYAGASLLTLFMVGARGWRPLIHLSFLFTLGGGVFFAWTAEYYQDAHAGVMLPVLLILAAIHVAMPIVEKTGSPKQWVERLDLAYMLALPTCTALLALLIAPTRIALSTELIWLGVIWALAAAALKILQRNGQAAHVAIAAALMLLGLAARFRNLPWELLGLAMSVGALAYASLRQPVGRLHSVLAGLVLLFGAIHVLSSVAVETTADAFANGAFVQRIVAAALLITAGAICRRVRQVMDTLLLAVGILWAFIAIGMELVRFELATISLVAHWFFILAAVSLWIPGRRVRTADERVALLVVLVVVTALWSSFHAGPIAAWVSLAGATLALVGIAIRPMSDIDSQGGRIAAAIATPVVAAIWVVPASPEWNLVVGASVGVGVLAIAQAIRDERVDWLETAADVFAVAFGALLAGATLMFIVRAPSGVMLEVVCLIGLSVATFIRRGKQSPIEANIVACVAGIALLLQANLMRLLGPPGTMSIVDVLTLKWPAVISLLWASVGSALTIWSRKVGSRSVWVGGATLLVGAAVKVVLVDFGSLGQLANILAVIGAGVVFLLVGWLAPMPPAAESTEGEAKPARSGWPASEPAEDSIDARNKRTAWTLAVLIGVVGIAAEFGGPVFGLYRSAQNRIERNEAPSDPNVPKTLPTITVSAPEFDTRPEPPAPEEAATDAFADSAPSASAPAAQTDAAEPRNAPRKKGNLGINLPPDIPAEPTTGATEQTTTPPASVPPSPTAGIDRDYHPPATVDEQGNRTYTQYSLPQASRASVPDDGRKPPVPAMQEQGLDQLMREGRLRRATPRDVETWRLATGSARGPDLKRYGYNEPIDRVYVVLREMTYPEGLTGAHAVTFIVPRNVPRPYGNPGHSAVLETP